MEIFAKLFERSLVFVYHCFVSTPSTPLADEGLAA